MTSSKHNQFDVWLINLDPTIGSGIRKSRPCVIISPDEMNYLKTLIVAPLTSHGFEAPSRITCNFNNKPGLVVLDQIRTVDKKCFIKKLGTIHYTVQRKISDTLIEMFQI